jgi:RNA polymerase sigma-B factor
MSATLLPTAESSNLQTCTDGLLARLACFPAGHPQRHRLRAEIIELNLPYAHRLAARYSHCGEPIDDLNQVAALALTLAVNRYDPDRGTAFHAYATPTILGGLRRHLRDTGWAVHVPRPLQELALHIKQAEADVTNRLRHTATPTDLAAALHITKQQALAGIQVTRAGAYHPTSLNEPVADDPFSPTLLDLLGGLDPAIQRAETKATIRALLAQLPERDRHILTMRYYCDMTQATIAGRIGVSQMHVSRLIRQSLARLRERMPGD